MFSFFKKKASSAVGDFGFLHTDMHSHLIPGIDDGAPDVETAVALVRRLQDMGFERIITTPHVMADLYANTPETILGGLEVLRAALKAAGIHLPVSAAAEYLMDEEFGNKIAAGGLLTLPGNHVLVEMSFIGEPPNLYDYLFRLQTRGYKPILAHPERYMFLHKDMAAYERLRQAGCLFQVNLLSLDGYYGKAVQQTAEKLINKGWVELLGTDLHHQRHADALGMLLQSRKAALTGISNAVLRAAVD